jgi:hypothetical protein
MAIQVLVHIVGEDSILGDLETMPASSDQVVVVHNPRMRDGKDLRNLEDEVSTIVVPWHRINFIEVMPSTEAEEVITHVRES